MDEPVSDTDRNLVEFLDGCTAAVTVGEMTAYLKAELWRREDPPLWIVNILDSKDLTENRDFVNPCPGPMSSLSGVSHPNTLSREERNVFWAIQELRWPKPLHLFDASHTRAELIDIYRRNPHIVERFRALFPDIAWEEPADE